MLDACEFSSPCLQEQQGGNSTIGWDQAAEEEGDPEDDVITATPISQTFPWDEYTQGLVLSSFGYGYWITQIAGGRLAEKFGIKRIYGTALLLTAILTLLSPTAAKLGRLII